MRAETKAMIAEKGGKAISAIVRLAMTRPRKRSAPESETSHPIEEPKRQELPMSPAGEMVEIPLDNEGEVIVSGRTQQGELDYRWECCMKHLGGASGLLLEAYERAIDEGIGEGTGEKIMEALNAHSTMEADLEKMLAMPEAKEQAEKLLSGVRAFRRACWEAKLPTGGGTKEDVADARLWNDILYTEAYSSVKAQPGEACIEAGM